MNNILSAIGAGYCVATLFFLSNLLRYSETSLVFQYWYSPIAHLILLYVIGAPTVWLIRILNNYFLNRG